MSKQPSIKKSRVSTLIKDKDIISLPIVVNKTRSCACKLKYLLLWLVNLEFFFFSYYFEKKMGRSGDGKRNIFTIGMALPIVTGYK